jgi:hypothetical protein
MAKAKTKRSKTARTPGLKLVQARAEQLMKRASKQATKLLKDAERTAHGLERRGEKLLGAVEASVAKAVTPALQKSFASKRDFDALVRRVDELEKGLATARESPSAVA